MYNFALCRLTYFEIGAGEGWKSVGPIMRKVKGVLQRDKKEKYLLHTVKGRKGNWIGHMLSTNCRLKNVIQEKIEREDEEEDVSSYCMALKETRRSWNLKEAALHRTVWRTGFGRGYGPVVRHCVLMRLTHQRRRRRNQK
jgi:hypothetical protein